MALLLNEWPRADQTAVQKKSYLGKKENWHKKIDTGK